MNGGGSFFLKNDIRSLVFLKPLLKQGSLNGTHFFGEIKPQRECLVILGDFPIIG